MYVGVREVKPLDNYKLLITFENNEKRIFDMTKYLEIGKFKELKDKELFNQVRVSFDTIEWPNFLDIDPEFLYKNSIKMEN